MTCLGIGLSACILFAVGPTIIAQAYRGESLPILNAMIRGQALHSTEHYLRVWRDLSIKILTVEAALGLVLALLSWPPFQRAVDRVLGSPMISPPNGAHFGMTRWQLVFANGVVCSLLGAQIFDMAMQREDWPFSNYSMYAGEQTERSTWIRVYGVTAAGEFVVVPKFQLRPFDAVRINYAFSSHVLDRTDQATAGLNALQSLYSLYEAGRRAGEHDGPAIHSLRLYREEWQIEPSLANKSRPMSRQLIYEFRVAL